MADAYETIHLMMNHLDKISDVMGRAFQNDPIAKYLVPDDIKRTRLLPSLLGSLVRYCSHYGEVYTTPALEGSACWLSPGNTKPTLVRMVRIGIHVAPLELGWGTLRRLINLANYTDLVHRRFAPRRHWYLWALGIDPLLQGQGIGTMLLRPILSPADTNGLSCYLETGNELNIPFYNKHGFKVVNEGEVAGNGPHVWAMLRDPLS